MRATKVLCKSLKDKIVKSGRVEVKEKGYCSPVYFYLEKLVTENVGNSPVLHRGLVEQPSLPGIQQSRQDKVDTTRTGPMR